MWYHTRHEKTYLYPSSHRRRTAPDPSRTAFVRCLCVAPLPDFEGIGTRGASPRYRWPTGMRRPDGSQCDPRLQCPWAGGAARGAFLQHRQPMGIEAVDHIANRLVVASQLASDSGGSLPPCRCLQNLAAAQHKGIGRTQSCLDLALFVFGERTDKDRFSHVLYDTTFPITFGAIALGELFPLFYNALMHFNMSESGATKPPFMRI